MGELIIEAGRADRHYWRDLWQFRELFGFLAWRDIIVRYKQTAIGVLWAVIRPTLTIFVGAGIFGKLAGLNYNGVPAVVSICAATLPWYFFSSALSESAGSLVGNANLISKIYFPRMVLPASAVVVAFVDFAVTLFILAGVMLWHHVWPTWRLCTLPFFTLLAFISAMGPGLLFTALNVKYRDFRYVIPFVVQFGQFVSPVFYTTEEVRAKFGDWGRIIIAANPVVSVIDGFRWAICGTGSLDWPSFVVSTTISLFFLFFSIQYFRKVEKSFADVI